MLAGIPEDDLIVRGYWNLKYSLVKARFAHEKNELQCMDLWRLKGHHESIFEDVVLNGADGGKGLLSGSFVCRWVPSIDYWPVNQRRSQGQMDVAMNRVLGWGLTTRVNWKVLVNSNNGKYFSRMIYHLKCFQFDSK